MTRDFLEMERRGLRLARSYQFSEQLQSFTTTTRNDATEILDWMAQKGTKKEP
jgi:hypothetical protein